MSKLLILSLILGIAACEKMTVYAETGSGTLVPYTDFFTLDWAWTAEVAHETFPWGGNWDS